MAVLSIYNGLNAKVRALKGQLLTAEDYQGFAQLRSVEDIGHKLQEYPFYSAVLGDIPSKDMRRGLIEQRILLSLAGDFSRIYRFIYDFRLKSYFDAFFMRNEIKIINYLLSAICDERDIPYSTPELNVLTGSNMNIDFARLATSKTISELIDNLRDTPFHDVLAQAYDGGASLFELEMRLDIAYYLRLWKLQKKYLEKVSQKAMMQINGTEIDLRNILWVYRLKNYYQMEDNAIYANLIPIQYRLRKEQLARMVEARDPDTLWSEIKASPYGGDFAEEASIEHNYYIAMDKAYKRSQTQNPHSLAYAIGYIHAKEIEIKNIISLLEGVRYALDREDIFKYIILPQEKR